ncbi:MAG: histidine phosphatase family protein [Halochromatium sp.]
MSDEMRYRLVDLIRHGEVEGGPCFRGRRDDPLSAAGWAQLEAATGIGGLAPGLAPGLAQGLAQGIGPSPASEASAVEKPAEKSSADLASAGPKGGGLKGGGLKGKVGAPPWDRLLCSPAARCARFAERLGERIGLPVEPMEAFWERDFGAWEGLRAEQIPPESLARFWDDPSTYDPPDAEPFAAFRQRVLGGWHRILDGGGDHPLLIAHGGVIRVILGEWLGIPPQRLILIEVPPACRSRLRVPVGDGRPSLVAHGCGPLGAPRQSN